MRRVLSSLFFAIGALLTVFAAARLIFGVAMDLPLLPPVSLVRVNAVATIAAALVCFAAGALVGRRRRVATVAGSRPAA